MDAEFKKEQNSTLFCLVGALEGGFEGWVVPQGCPQKVNVPSKKNTFLRKPTKYTVNTVYILGSGQPYPQPCVPHQIQTKPCFTLVYRDDKPVW